MKKLSVALLVGMMILVSVKNVLAVGKFPEPGEVVINELMWMGSTSSDADEWIELRNTTGSDIDLSQCDITRKDGVEKFMLTIPNDTTILAGGYFLISNYDAGNSKINVSPDLVRTAVSLDNDQLQIKLYDGPWDTSTLIDTADDGVGNPAEGDNVNKYSMVRNSNPGDGTLPGNWHTADRAFGWDSGATELGTPGNDNSLPVTLSSFAAISTDSGVTLKWRTESEVDHLGWNIYRSKKKDGKFVKINKQLVPGVGNSAMPNTYQFADKTAIKGRQYYYYLEDVDIAGTRNKSSIIPISKDAGKLTTTWGKIKKG